MHFAKLAHEGQFRADGVEPYFNHVYRVFKRMLVLMDNPDIGNKGLVTYEQQEYRLPTSEENILCAALLHDIVEDTKYDLEDINKEFGYNVDRLVDWLTNKDDKNLNRKQRIDKREEKYFMMPTAAKAIKLADRIDNVLSIESKGDDFKDKYLYETIGLMWAIYDEDNNPAPIIDKLFATLNIECVKACSDIEGRIGILKWRDLQRKWERENPEKIAKYGY